MKLLQDFFRLRVANGATRHDRRAAARRPRTVTVPAPLAAPRPAMLDMHWNNREGERASAQWHTHAAD